jgi:hypothetical protein
MLFFSIVTTPSMTALDQSKNTSETTDTFSLPVETVKNPKYIFYGLAGNPIEDVNRKAKKDIIDSNLTEEIDVTTPNKNIF